MSLLGVQKGRPLPPAMASGICLKKSGPDPAGQAASRGCGQDLKDYLSERSPPILDDRGGRSSSSSWVTNLNFYKRQSGNKMRGKVREEERYGPLKVTAFTQEPPSRVIHARGKN